MKKADKIVSFLVSGRGSNFQKVAENILKKKINARIGIVISDKADALSLQKAEAMGVENIFIDPKKFESKEEYEKEIVKQLRLKKTDLVVAAGYMRILTRYIINQYKNRIINIHPSLLPSFPGMNAQKQALEYGVKLSGCTCHFIDEGTDTGPIILQSAVSLTDNDDITSLSTKILKEEHKILSQCVKLFCEDKITLKENKVFTKK